MDVEKLIFSYLKGKNFRSSENALKSELKNYLKSEGNSAFIQSICIPAMSELLKSIHDLNQDQQYFTTFSTFRSWVESTADFYQNDLKKIIGPIFIFTYLEMVKRDMSDSIEKFFKEFSSCHWDQSDLDKLVKIRNSEQDFGIFSQRYCISIDSYSFSQMIYFLETHSLVIILKIINKNFQIDLKPSNCPAFLLGKDLKIQTNKTGLVLEEEKIKRENKVPLPTTVEIQQISGSETKEKIVLRPDSQLTIVCHTVRNANEALCLDVSKDSTLLVAGFEDSIIRVFWLVTSKFPFELIGHSGAVFSVSISPLNDLLISGSDDCSIKLWSLKTNICLTTFNEHIFPVWTIQFAPTGYYFASGSNDKVAYLWSTESIKPLRMFAGHNSDVISVAFHPKCHYLATSSADKTVRIWDVANGECLRIFNKHTQAVNFCVFSKDGKTLFTGDDLGDLYAWDVNKKALMWKVELVAGVVSIGVCYDDCLILVGCDNKEVYSISNTGKVMAYYKSKVEVLFTGFSYRNLGITAGIVRINPINL